jgi:hypothetical protein
MFFRSPIHNLKVHCEFSSIRIQIQKVDEKPETGTYNLKNIKK